MVSCLFVLWFAVSFVAYARVCFGLLVLLFSCACVFKYNSVAS